MSNMLLFQFPILCICMNMDSIVYLNIFLKVTCGSPPSVTHATETRTGVNEGDEATYTCVSTHAIQGLDDVKTDDATCGADGTWSNVPSCVCKYLSVLYLPQEHGGI